MKNSNLVEPNFNTSVEGFYFLVRGPDATGRIPGWQCKHRIFFRCAKCGAMMNSTVNEYFSCDCGSMYLDVDGGRFGSNLGDMNILVYEKLQT